MSDIDDVLDKLGDVLGKINDVLGKINDVLEKCGTIETVINSNRYLYSYCDSCNGNGIVEDAGEGEEGPNPPYACLQCGGEGLFAIGIIDLNALNSAKKSLSGSAFTED